MNHTLLHNTDRFAQDPMFHVDGKKLFLMVPHRVYVEDDGEDYKRFSRLAIDGGIVLYSMFMICVS